MCNIIHVSLLTIRYVPEDPVVESGSSIDQSLSECKQRIIKSTVYFKQDSY